MRQQTEPCESAQTLTFSAISLGYRNANQAVLAGGGALPVAFSLSTRLTPRVDVNRRNTHMFNDKIAHTAKPAVEKCYGISKAGENSCTAANGSHGCAGQSHATGS